MVKNKKKRKTTMSDKEQRVLFCVYVFKRELTSGSKELTVAAKKKISYIKEKKKN